MLLNIQNGTHIGSIILDLIGWPLLYLSHQFNIFHIGIVVVHHYSTDQARWRVLVGIGAIALAVTTLVNPIFRSILPQTLQGTGSTLTVLSVAGFLYFIYRRIAWRVLGRIFGNEIPNLNGEWVAERELPARVNNKKSLLQSGASKLVIDQEWNNIQLDYFDTEGFYIRSDSAKVSTTGANNPELLFTYTGEIDVGESTEIEPVSGTFRLRYFDSEEPTLSGYHYSDNSTSRQAVSFILQNRNRDIPNFINKIQSIKESYSTQNEPEQPPKL